MDNAGFVSCVIFLYISIMEIKEIEGNLLDSTAEYILQQVNCQRKMNSGVAKAIREKWPIVFEKYFDYCIITNAKIEPLLGTVLPVRVNDTQTVLNLFAQENFGYDGRRYTSYDAIDTCFEKVAKKCEKDGIKSIALPYHMSCDRGGANWNIIMEMIKQHFEDLDITIEIWKL